MNRSPQGFHDITPADRTVIQSFTQNAGGTLSTEYAFANLLAWGLLYGIRYCIASECLWLHDAKDDILYFPIAAPNQPEITPETLILWSKRLQDQGFNGRISYIPETWYATYGAPTGMTYQTTEDFWEYYYTSEALLNLSGRSLSAKRNLNHQFERNHPNWQVERIDPKQMPWLSQFLEAWHATRTASLDLLDEDLEALDRAFAFWDESGFHGLRLYEGDTTYALSVWSLLTNDTANIHFEKALPDCKGASQMINRETARLLHPHITWINREQDLGIPGLRHAKRSYQPAYMLRIGTFVPSDKHELQDN